MGSAVDMLLDYKERAVPIEAGEPADGSFSVGVFADEDRPEYCSEYAAVVATASGGASK
jgi:hypothetical protein